MKSNLNSSKSLSPVSAFAVAQLLGYLRNWRSSLLGIFTPLLMFFLFYVIDAEFAASMLPLIVGLAVMLSGQMMAQTLILWRNIRIFARLQITPTPMSQFLISTFLVQMLYALVQAAVVLGIGSLFADFPVDLASAAMMLAVLALGSMTFLGLGAVLAVFMRKVESSSSVYSFILLPMIFLGGSVYQIEGLEQIGRWFPTSLLTYQLNPFFGYSNPYPGVEGLLGLAAYALVFAVFAIAFFKTGD